MSLTLEGTGKGQTCNPPAAVITVLDTADADITFPRNGKEKKNTKTFMNIFNQ